MEAPDHVWYVAYGSNLSRARFDLYLRGAEPYAEPADWRAVTIPHRLFFAYFTERWGGGAAFIDPEVGSGSTRCRAWLVERRQFEAVMGAENRQRSLPLPEEALRLRPGGSTAVRPSWYGTLLALEPIDDQPAFTFTHAHPLPVPTQPSRTYVDVITTGLAESHGLDRASALSYLAERGVVGAGVTPGAAAQ